MNVYTLGTGAPLAYTRATLGILVEAEGAQPLLIDTCSGNELIRRLHALGKPLNQHHAILTHRHGDHIGGVLPLAIAVQPLHLYGPAETLDVARQLIELTYGEIAYRVLDQTSFHPVEPGPIYDIAGYQVEFFAVQHRVTTYAVRLTHADKIFAFSADSAPCDSLIACARNADLFLCDAICSSQEEDAAIVAGLRKLAHPTADEAASMAQQAGAKRLGLVHLARFATPEKMLAEARALFHGPVDVPDDNACYVV
ncbi:MAG: MBL fold metallo-hydrolase [Caldilineaceae bacterium]